MANPYSKSDYFTSFIIFVLLALVNFGYFYELYATSGITKISGFTYFFVSTVFLIILAIPFLEKRLSLITNDKLIAFMDLPKENDKFSYPVLSGFLGDQALGAFLGTVLIYTTKIAIDEYGFVLSAIYAGLLFIISIVIITLSLARFVMHFTKKHWVAYIFASITSLFIMFSFFHLGLKLA